MMKKILLALMFLTLTGCLKISIGQDDSSQTSLNNTDTCPEQPTQLLTAKNTEDVELSEAPLAKSGQVSAQKMVGYSFEAEAGQKFTFSSDDDICTWLYAPDNQLITNNELTKKGKYIFQVGTIKGSKSFELTMNFAPTTQTTANNTPAPQPTTTYTPAPQPTATYTPPAPSRNSLTQTEAVNIVQGWYNAKPNIFGGSFDRGLAAKYITGDLYYKTLQKPEEGSSGSVGWLQDRGCYYTYAYSNIEQVWIFDNKGSRPYLKIRISEGLQLHGPSRHGCGTKFQSYRKNVNYWFEQENGVWKIYDYKVE